MRRLYWLVLLAPLGLVLLSRTSTKAPDSDRGAIAVAGSPAVPAVQRIRTETVTGSEFNPKTETETAPASDLPPPRLTSLRGARVPDGLRADANGDLVKDSSLRLFFDFFLAAGQDVSQEDLQQIVQQWIRTHLASVAAAQALDIWQRYQSYRNAFMQIQQSESLPATASQLTQQDLDRIGAAFQARQQLQQQWLPDVESAWFADDNAYDNTMLTQLRTTLAAGGQAKEPVKISTPAWHADTNPDYQDQLAQIQQNPGLDKGDKQQLEDQLRQQFYPGRRAYIHQALRDLSH